MSFLEVSAFLLAISFVFIFLINIRIKFNKEIRKICMNRKIFEFKKEFSRSLNIETIILLTLVWVFIIIYLFVNNLNNVEPDKALGLNEWGDYLAGLFAPILFTWVVFGIFLQKKEFTNAIDEYKRSIKFLKKQSINTDIQHQNAWFDRNADMLEKYIDLLISNNGPLEELNTKIIGQNIYTFRELVSNIMNIVELDKYINKSLKNIKNSEKDFNSAIDNLNIEYKILFGKNVNSSKNIALKIYLHTYRTLINIEKDEERKEAEEFRKFVDLKYLITNKKRKEIEIFRQKNIINLDSSFVDIMADKIDEDLRNLIICEEKVNEKTI